MKKALLLSTLLSSLAAQATMNVRMNLELKVGESTRTMVTEFNLESGQPLRLSSPAFEIDVVANTLENAENEVEFSFIINAANDDCSYISVAAPVIKTVLDTEAVVELANDKGDTLNLTVTASQVQETE